MGKGGGDVTEDDGGPEVNEPHRVATVKILVCQYIVQPSQSFAAQ